MQLYFREFQTKIVEVEGKHADAKTHTGSTALQIVNRIKVRYKYLLRELANYKVFKPQWCELPVVEIGLNGINWSKMDF